MKGRHEADLAWRFQHAEEDVERCASDAEARIAARERVQRIDGALSRLAKSPVSLARVLRARYGLAEILPEIRPVFREHAPVSTMTLEAPEWFARQTGRPPRAGSHDVERWLGAMCGRVRTREATGADTVIIDEIRRAAHDLVADAEAAYEASAGGGEVSDARERRTGRKLKPFYTVPELALALGISRWTVRRWLDASRIPYELRRRAGGTSGGRIIVLASELMTYAPSYFASIREELEVDA